MATSFGESTDVKLLYNTTPVYVHQVKPGDQIEHDGRVYRVFRWLRMVRPDKPLGCVAVAVPYDAMGTPSEESVALCFDDANEPVRLVCGAVVSSEVRYS